MHILYVDDSGAVDDPATRYFVLGGVSIFERGLYHLIKAADELVASFNIGDPQEIELHGSPMYSGRGIWRFVRERSRREQMIHNALGLLANQRAVKLFAVAVDRAGTSPNDPLELSFEELCNRFNLCNCALLDWLMILCHMLFQTKEPPLWPSSPRK